jgi:hypothetical protein
MMGMVMTWTFASRLVFLGFSLILYVPVFAKEPNEQKEAVQKEAVDEQAQVFRGRLESSSDTVIDQLRWSVDLETQTPRLQRGAEGDKSSIAYVKLLGSYLRADAALMFREHLVKITAHHEFEITVPIVSNETEFTLTAFHPSGRREVQKFRVIFPLWQEFTQHPIQKL